MNGIRRRFAPVCGTMVGILLLLASMAGFLRCWDYGLVNLDDYAYLTLHDSVVCWQGWSSIRDFLTNVSEGIWMPLTWLSYALDYRLFGSWYGGFHLHAVFVHFINACLVWWFLCELFSEKDTGESVGSSKVFCLIGALVWAAHPLRCESVVFLASRKDVLSFFWELLGLICWVRTSRRTERRDLVAGTAAACLCFVLGSFCKPSVMTFPLLCLLVDLVVVRRMRLIRYAFPFAYMVFLGGFSAWQQSAGGATGSFAAEPLLGRLLGAAAAFGIYLRNFVWPVDLAPQCLNRWPALPRFLLPGALISLAVGLYLYRRGLAIWRGRGMRTAPDWLFAGAMWFAVAVAPMLGVANFGYHAFADRFTYIPAVGLSIMLVVCLRRTASHVGQMPVLGASAAIIAVLVAMTARQTGFWRDDGTLFTRTLQVDGDDNALAHRSLAAWYFEFTHDLPQALAEYEKTVKLDEECMLGSYPAYFIALVEAGRGDEIRERFAGFEKQMRRVLGEDGMRLALSGSPDLDVVHQTWRDGYRTLKLIWWLTDETGLSAAEEYLKSIEDRPKLYESPVMLYIRRMYWLLRGNQKEADRLLAQLCASENRRGYLRFRFLRWK